MLAGCAPLANSGDAPIPTMPAVLAITPAPTINIDATATAYAQRLLPSPTVAALYTVQGGDTLSSLAERFATSVDELVAVNNLTDPNNLQAGQTLLIPSLLREPQVTATPTP
jgi:LysM repeat protein